MKKINIDKNKVKLIISLIKDLKNDSKKVVDNSEKALNLIAYNHFFKLKQITNKYNIRYFEKWSGKLKDIWFDWKEKNVLYFVCHNGLSGGCEDSDQKYISIEELSNFDYNTFELNCKKERIEILNKVISSKKTDIEIFQKELKKYNEED